MNKTIAPYGAWRSPISADLLAAAGVSLSAVRCSGGATYWLEGRPWKKDVLSW